MENKISLPIDSYLQQILTSLTAKTNLVLTAPPGTGKTTRVPLYLAAQFKKIIVLVPKRIAAVSAASRVSEENNIELGQAVGYQVRFDKSYNEHTKIIYMTVGVFLKKCLDDDFFKSVDLVIFDEFHERSSQMDIALGLCYERQLLQQNPKILVMSATLNNQKLTIYLDQAESIQVELAPHPLKIIKSKQAQKLNIDFNFTAALVENIKNALNESKKDILVFLPGLSEINFCKKEIEAKLPAIPVYFLHSSVSLEEQKKLLKPSTQRRIILATNIAESSITLPSVDCVIDSGLEKRSFTESKLGFSGVETIRCSLYSAKQRAGRAARLGPGLCYQLWHESDEQSMPTEIMPEVLTSNLISETLLISSYGIQNLMQFSWLDKPKKGILEAQKQIESWGLFNTTKGRLVEACPLDIESSILFVEMSSRGFKKDISKLLAFIETTAFEKEDVEIDLNHISLNFLGKKIEQQLLSLNTVPSDLLLNYTDFFDNLIEVFFQFFPYRVAQRKDQKNATSSMGRGLELAHYLTKNTFDRYYLVFSGREKNKATTICSFAIGLTKELFEKHSKANIKSHITVSYDEDKKSFYKVEKKTAANFVVSESSKNYFDEKTEPQLFKTYLSQNFSNILQKHPDYILIKEKIQFLKKFKDQFKLTDADFEIEEGLSDFLYNCFGDTLTSLHEFYEQDLHCFLNQLDSQNLNAILSRLPKSYRLPNHKNISIDYTSDQAPKLSARIQDFFGLKETPKLLETMPYTLELLAPNYRPAQVTKDLNYFWNNSYYDVRKDLRARYPKHSWPDTPSEAQAIIRNK